ncbi:hypothetical protein MRY82_07690 [bacterium]|nr:hypothetical protein [bacterium]
MHLYSNYLNIFLLILVFSLTTACDRQKKYQQEKIQAYEKKLAPPTYKALGHGYTALPKNLNPAVLEQRKLFVEFLQAFQDQCLTLIHLYHPSDVDIESVALCIKTEEKNVGIYQNKACVVALIDHIYQRPMPYYSENNSHWGIQKACESNAMLNKINQPDTLTTVNPITYARMKLNDDGFSMHTIQDRLELAQAIKTKISP